MQLGKTIFIIIQKYKRLHIYNSNLLYLTYSTHYLSFVSKASNILIFSHLICFSFTTKNILNNLLKIFPTHSVNMIQNLIIRKLKKGSALHTTPLLLS